MQGKSESCMFRVKGKCKMEMRWDWWWCTGALVLVLMLPVLGCLMPDALSWVMMVVGFILVQTGFRR